MALIRDAQNEWSDPVTLTKDEIWQARHGSVYLTTTADPEADDGITLVMRDGLRIGAGLSVRYRKTGSTDALIVREAVQ